MSRTAEREGVRLQARRRRVCALVEAAEVQRRPGGHGKAESLLRQALAIAVKALGRDDLVVATLMNNLAVVHEYQGRFAEASWIPFAAGAMRPSPCFVRRSRERGRNSA